MSNSELMNKLKELKTIFQEVFNMNKDFFKCIVKSSPSHLGEITPITENGDVITDDIENIDSTEFDETIEEETEWLCYESAGVCYIIHLREMPLLLDVRAILKMCIQ